MIVLSFFRSTASNLLRFVCNLLTSQAVPRMLYSRSEKRGVASPAPFHPFVLNSSRSGTLQPEILAGFHFQPDSVRGGAREGSRQARLERKHIERVASGEYVRWEDVLDRARAR